VFIALGNKIIWYFVRFFAGNCLIFEDRPVICLTVWFDRAKHEKLEK
jgi:hypothetical protein